MLTKSGLEEISTMLEQKFNKQNKRFDKIEEKLTINTTSIIKIEQKIDAALELRRNVREIRQEVRNHEERITNLEEV